MNRRLIPSLIVLLLFPVAASVASAHESAIRTMATITLHLNHYPNAAELRQLEAIDRQATSAEIHTLARALLHMRHTVQPEDAQALRRLASDAHASQPARELASILLGIQHHPSASDRQRLQALIEGDD